MISRMTKTASLFALAGSLWFALAAGPALAQDGNPVTASFLGNLRNVQRNLEEAADVMPEEHYGFRPTPDVRTFGEWVGHTALSVYNYCSQIKGEPRPDIAQTEKLKAKAELSKALKDAFAYCAEAVKGLDDQKALTEVAVGNNKFPRVRPMVTMIGSMNSHYGSMAVYMRLKGQVPPSTARAQKAAKKN